MKRIIGILCLLSYFSINAQNNCSTYYPMAEGSISEYKNYDKRGKLQGTSTYSVKEITNEGSTTIAKMDLTYTDEKDEELYTSSYNLACDNNVVRLDYKSLFPTEMMEQYTSMGVEMDVTGSDIELPNNLSVGQALADAHVMVEMKIAGIGIKTDVQLTERKVVAKEKLTTPAGTFDCFLITDKNTTKTMGKKILSTSKMWLAEGVGMVKEESYNKKGKLTSKTELNAFTQ